MPEIKNTFLKSKMNKDLDSRIIPNGEYRNAENISISTSEGSDVGALENIKGNLKLTDFGLSDANLEIIGNCIDTANNRIFFFITNNSSEDNSFSNTSGEVVVEGVTFQKNGAKHYISVAQIIGDDIDVNVQNISTTILVSGSFLNFSTLNPILGVNVLEDLLFWTDDRNQPRKINIKRALTNPYVSDAQPGYYSNEDHISVAKYAPYTSISFLKDLISPGSWESGGLQRTTLKNEADEYLSPHVIAPCSISSDKLSFEPVGIINGIEHFGVGKDVNENPLTIKDFLFEGNEQVVEDYNIEIKVTCEGKEGEAFVEKIPNSTDVYLKSATGASIDPTTLGWGDSGTNCVVQFSAKNPDYNSRFVGDKDLLREKFVRFSYRFKYDDGEYSLTAPFSQHAFMPKQYGYFIGDDDKSTAESSIVDFMENQVTTAGLMIDLPCAPNKLKENLHVEEIQLLYKASDEQALKVIADIEPGSEGLPIKAEIQTNGDTGFSDQAAPNFLEPTGGSGEGIKLAVRFNSNGTISEIIGVSCQGEGYKINDILTIKNPDATGAVDGATIRITELDSKYFYNYKSQKPIKVLPEKEIVRVSDIVPMRAKTQEVVGNRIVYGNFLQNNKTPNSLNYEVRQIDKGSDENLKYDQELINHTLKQGRTYQAGIVLQDRYGRASNIIINADNSKSTEFNSTYFSSYTNGGVDPLSWPGNSLNIVFDEKIPTAKTIDYNGTWSETNPLGWYTYKVVVKQQEQDYYNIYTPGSLTGNVVFTGYSTGVENNDPTPLTYGDENKVAHIALFNDNINKIPRDLNKVGPSDRVYSSSVVLYNIVNNRNVNQDAAISYKLSQQTIQVGQQTITTIRPFGEMGDWTKYKNVDLHYLNMGPGGESQYPENTFIYPGPKGNIDPFFLDNNKNPLIATLKIDKRIGATASEQGDPTYRFAKSLTIFETKPTKSQLDIYYETSSSDTIANFNSEVDKDETLFSVGGITEVQSNLIEDQEPGDFISNGFQAVDNNGIPLSDSSVQINITKVVKSNGTEVPENEWPFKVTPTGGSGTSVQPVFYFELGKKLIYKTNSDFLDDYLVDVNVNTLEDINGLDIQEINLKLSNKKPVIGKISWFYNGEFFDANTSNSVRQPLDFNSEIDRVHRWTKTDVENPSEFSAKRGDMGGSFPTPVISRNRFNQVIEGGLALGIGGFPLFFYAYTSNGSLKNNNDFNNMLTSNSDGVIRYGGISNNRLTNMSYHLDGDLGYLNDTGSDAATSDFRATVTTCTVDIGDTDFEDGTNGVSNWGAFIKHIGNDDHKLDDFNPFQSFGIKEVTMNDNSIEKIIRWKSGEIDKRDIPGSGTGSQRGGLMFTLKLNLMDAGGQNSASTSDDFYARFIVYK
tara:strand:- start:1899 stop:6017 length:4119 start_codon:yes stop_codon:yes gene_type:complete